MNVPISLQSCSRHIKRATLAAATVLAASSLVACSAIDNLTGSNDEPSLAAKWSRVEMSAAEYPLINRTRTHELFGPHDGQPWLRVTSLVRPENERSLAVQYSDNGVAWMYIDVLKDKDVSRSFVDADQQGAQTVVLFAEYAEGGRVEYRTATSTDGRTFTVNTVDTGGMEPSLVWLGSGGTCLFGTDEKGVPGVRCGDGDVQRFELPDDVVHAEWLDVAAAGSGHVALLQIQNAAGARAVQPVVASGGGASWEARPDAGLGDVLVKKMVTHQGKALALGGERRNGVWVPMAWTSADGVSWQPGEVASFDMTKDSRDGGFIDEFFQDATIEPNGTIQASVSTGLSSFRYVVASQDGRSWNFGDFIVVPGGAEDDSNIATDGAQRTLLSYSEGPTDQLVPFNADATLKVKVEREQPWYEPERFPVDETKDWRWADATPSGGAFPAVLAWGSVLDRHYSWEGFSFDVLRRGQSLPVGRAKPDAGGDSLAGVPKDMGKTAYARSPEGVEVFVGDVQAPGGEVKDTDTPRQLAVYSRPSNGQPWAAVPGMSGQSTAVPIDVEYGGGAFHLLTSESTAAGESEHKHHTSVDGVTWNHTGNVPLSSVGTHTFDACRLGDGLLVVGASGMTEAAEPVASVFQNNAWATVDQGIPTGAGYFTSCESVGDAVYTTMTHHDVSSVYMTKDGKTFTKVEGVPQHTTPKNLVGLDDTHLLGAATGRAETAHRAELLYGTVGEIKSIPVPVVGPATGEVVFVADGNVHVGVDTDGRLELWRLDNSAEYLGLDAAALKDASIAVPAGAAAGGPATSPSAGGGTETGTEQPTG